MTDVSTTKVLSELSPQAFALFVAASGLWARSLSSEKGQAVEQLADFLATGGGDRQKLAIAAATQASIALSVTSFSSAAIALLIDCYFGASLRPKYAYFYTVAMAGAVLLACWAIQLFIATRPHQLALTKAPWLPFKINDGFRARPVEQLDFWAVVMLIVLMISGALKVISDEPPAPPKTPVEIQKTAAAAALAAKRSP